MGQASCGESQAVRRAEGRAFTGFRRRKTARVKNILPCARGKTATARLPLPAGDANGA